MEEERKTPVKERASLLRGGNTPELEKKDSDRPFSSERDESSKIESKDFSRFKSHEPTDFLAFK